MAAVNSGEIWSVDFGLAAKVRPALLLTGNPAAEELDLVTVLLHTTSLSGNRWELAIPKTLPEAGCFSSATDPIRFHGQTGAQARCPDGG